MSNNIFAADMAQLKKETEQMLVKNNTNNNNMNSSNKTTAASYTNGNHNHSNNNTNSNKHSSYSRIAATDEDHEPTSTKNGKEEEEEEATASKDGTENNTVLLNAEELSHQKQENLRKQELVRQSLEYKVGLLQKEQQKLAKVNEELEGIEHELAKDVEKLREMIDQLSRNIAFWEEDYNIKKAAYLESEKQLTSAKERRDNLTKHLHTIIMTNESRKSSRLQQLMAALAEAETVPSPLDASHQNLNTTNGSATHDTTLKRNNNNNTAQYSGPL